MTNLSQHGNKTIRNTSIPHGINKRFIQPPDVFWIGGVIYNVTGHTVREFRNPGCHEVVNVIRNRPDGNRFVPSDDQRHNLPRPQEQITHVCVSGLLNRNPRSTSRVSSCSDNHGFVANPPTRNANCSRLTRSSVQEYSRTRTELVGSRCVKLSLIESTVDWIDGSKNSETSSLCARKFGYQFINSVSVCLPCQCQPPGLDSSFRLIISRRPKLDVLIRFPIRSRKHLLYPFVKLLGKCCQVLAGVEFGILQLLWLPVER